MHTDTFDAHHSSFMAAVIKYVYRVDRFVTKTLFLRSSPTLQWFPETMETMVVLGDHSGSWCLAGDLPVRTRVMVVVVGG